ncbi:MAG: hypothetical protein KKH49_04110, partial [Candidatus Omnitrophica bacterium]|nr:hypothetical protein [Candidatus Omnitrophota bacterium]
MTMIVGCHFKDGAVIVADSRVTSKEFPAGKKILSDTAQKIIPLGLKLAIAFAGDVPLANDIIFQIRKRITKNKRLRIPSKIATDLPRVAQYCYRKYKETNKNREWSVSLLLGAINPNGTILLWAYESPSFNIKIIRDDFVVLGSGAVVFSYLK